MEALNVALSVATITFPIALIIALGFLTVRIGYFPADGIAYLGQFVVRIALPAALFLALASQDIATILNPGLLLAYGSGTVLTGLGLFLCLLAVGRGVARSSVSVIGGAFCNCMIVGLPIVILLFEPPAVAVLAIVSFFQDLFILPVILVVADTASGQNWRESLTRIIGKTLRNPIVIAILLGALMAAAPLKLPDTAFKVIEILAGGLAATGLFMIGGILGKTQLQRLSFSFVPIVFVKLLVHPALVALAFWLFPIENTTFRNAAIFAAALPTLAIYPAIAAVYGDAEEAATAMLVSTVLSFGTIAGIMALVLG